ncbi:MAG: hypothetical protein M3P15_02080, partial [Actinomycetota bacterium]|nr:hypothetical protein [Actinomycetota bacterium]
TAVGSQLGLLLGALEHRPDSIRVHDELSRYSKYRQATLEQHGKFNREARIAIRDTWWTRFQRWSENLALG